MTRLLSTLVLIACVTAAPADASEASGEWQLLFNGSNLEGWTKFGSADFTVTNSTLRLNGGEGWLCHSGVYSNFVLELEWRALDPAFDSGIFVRAGTNGLPWPADAWQVGLARVPAGALMRGTKTIEPTDLMPVARNTWVKFRIEVEGTTARLVVNGEPAWEYKQLDAPAGHIGIQAEGKAYEFRNLRLLMTPSRN